MLERKRLLMQCPSQFNLSFRFSLRSFFLIQNISNPNPIKIFYLKRLGQRALTDRRPKALKPPARPGRIGTVTESIFFRTCHGKSIHTLFLLTTPTQASGAGWHARVKNTRSPGKPRGKARANILLARALLLPLSDNNLLSDFTLANPPPRPPLPGARQGRLYITGMLCKPARVLRYPSPNNLPIKRPVTKSSIQVFLSSLSRRSVPTRRPPK